MRDRYDALDAQLFEGVDVGAEVQLRGEDAMAAPMARQKGHRAPLQLAQDEGVGRLAKGSLHALFMCIGESRHRVKPAAADDSYLRLCQSLLLGGSPIPGPPFCILQTP
jgi:hypothetical protein